MKIAVVGSGYVGLALGVLLAQRHEVVALDIAPDKVAQINRRVCPIDDAELADYLQHQPLNLRGGRLHLHRHADRLRRVDQPVRHPLGRECDPPGDGDQPAGCDRHQVHGAGGLHARSVRGGLGKLCKTPTRSD